MDARDVVPGMFALFLFLFPSLTLSPFPPVGCLVLPFSLSSHKRFFANPSSLLNSVSYVLPLPFHLFDRSPLDALVPFSPSLILVLPLLVSRLTILLRVQNKDGSDFMGERLTVQFARGSRRDANTFNQERGAPRPRRTPHRMQISGLPSDTSWQVCSSTSFSTDSSWIFP